MNEELIENWAPCDMLEVTLKEPDDFLRVRETLTRIGVSAKRENCVLYQSCHILHKQGHYFIVHFKEMFLLDGKGSNLSRNDLRRRNTIATLLSDWGLLDILDGKTPDDFAPMAEIKIIPHRDKPFWDLRAKYLIGNSKGRSYT